MTRDDVIQIMKANGDAYLNEANRAEVPPERLWGVYYRSLLHGMERSNFHARAVAETHTEQGIPTDGGEAANELDDFDHLRAALVQILTASSLLLEMMPLPDGTAILTTAARNMEKLN